MITKLTYQSVGTSPDIERWHAFAEYNPDTEGPPFIGGSYDAQLMIESQGLYRNGTQFPYRFAQSTRNTWFADNFDWDTERAFQVERFDAQFGQRYITETTGLPSYDEARLIYGR